MLNWQSGGPEFNPRPIHLLVLSTPGMQHLFILVKNQLVTCLQPFMILNLLRFQISVSNNWVTMNYPTATQKIIIREKTK